MLPYVVIGAGPSGLAAVRRLLEKDIPVIGLEAHSGVGGLWDIDSKTSTMYDSAHLISSKSMTQFDDFPMRDDVATYPKHSELQQYFKEYADHFKVTEHYQFNCWVMRIEPIGSQWRVVYRQNGEQQELEAAGVIIAAGTLHEPKRLSLEGEFSGEQFHSSEYRSADVFEGKRVLIVGCGNSGCDMAVDAVHRASSVDMVVRRGYYFLPKFVMGKPTDTLGGVVKLPAKIKQWVDGLLVRLISGKPSQFGLPDPDYKMYESHPVINSMFLHHIGHGDIRVRPGISKVDDRTVYFSDGSHHDYDLILEATGYVLHYPFIDQALLNWSDMAPNLYLKMFTPRADNLFVVGMVEAAGLGWQPRDTQAQVIASFIEGRRRGSQSADRFWQTITMKTMNHSMQV
jgi:cation diffusion facilitator CzcD-associated flavoprotein CzcO